MPAVQSWIDHVPGDFVTLLWTKQLRLGFIQATLGPCYSRLYERLRAGAVKADLFRYICLYYIGGYYSDIDIYLRLPSILLFKKKAHVIAAIDLDGIRLLQGAILVARPKEPILRCAIGEVFDHSERRENEFISDLDVSGPGVLGECFRHVVGMDELRFSEGLFDVLDTEIHLFRSYIHDDGSHRVAFNLTADIVELQQGGLDYAPSDNRECDPGEHYSVLFRAGQIYNDDSTMELDNFQDTLDNVHAIRSC